LDWYWRPHFLYQIPMLRGKIWHYRQLTNNNVNDWSISVDGGIVSWRRDGHIIVMDYRAGEEKILTKNMDYDYFGMPSVSNREVAWRAYNLNTHTDTIFRWNGNTIEIIAEYGSGNFDFDGYPPSFYSIEPSLDHGEIAFAAWDGSDYEIFYWDGSMIMQITDNEYNDYEAQLSNGEISWTGYAPLATKPNIFFWNGETIQNVSNNSPWTCEDSNLNDGEIVYAGMQLEEGYSGDKKPDIFIWKDGGPAERVAALPGYDFEPEIRGSLVGWTGWPYGKNSAYRSVGLIWDGFKVLNALESLNSVSFPHFDDKALFLLANDGEDNELLWGSYILRTYSQFENYVHTIKTLPFEDRIYIANGNGGLEIVSINNFMNINRVASLNIDNRMSIFDIEKVGDFLFLANRRGSIDIVDIKDELNPILAQSIDTLNSPKHLVINGDYLYAGDRLGGVRIFDISLPYSTYEIGSIDLSGITQGLAIKGSIA
jgi:hypothetical protein